MDTCVPAKPSRPTAPASRSYQAWPRQRKARMAGNLLIALDYLKTHLYPYANKKS